jgi:hypothetical protein
MYKTTKFVALVSVLAVLLLSSFVFAEDKYDPYSPYNSAFGRQSMITGPMVQESDLVGYRLMGLGNVYQGTISGFAYDQTNGRVALVIITDVPNLGTETVALPFSFLQRDQGGNYMIAFPPDAPRNLFTSEDDWLTRYTPAMELGIVSGPIDSSFVESVYSRYGVAPYWSETTMEGHGMVIFTCNEILGKDIANAGRADDFVFDTSDGRVVFVVFSDVPGRSDHALVAVPFSSFYMNPDRTFAVRMDGDKLASAPSFDEHLLNDRAYAERVYIYYGVQPYWTE